MRKLSEYLLANPLYAMAVALFCALLPLAGIPGGFLAAILVGFVTLCRDSKTGLLVLAGVAIPVLALAVWKQTFFIDLVLVRCAFIWALASILRKWISWRLVLEVMTILGILIVLGFYLFLGDVSAWWSEVFSHYEKLLNSMFSGQLTEDKVHEMVVKLIPFATGFFVSLLLAGTALQLFLARWWQAALFNSGGLGREFREIRAGIILASIFTLTLIAALSGFAFAIDLLPVVILPLIIDGLSLLHKWGHHNKKIVYLIVTVYIGFVFLPVFVLIILALAGYIDCCYDLRKRYFNIPKKGV